MSENKIKSVIAATVAGNVIELYDHALFGILSYLLVAKYFPQGDETSRIVHSVGMFSVAYLIRPIGAFLSAWFANKLKLSNMLFLSLCCMGVSSLIIGVLPEYDYLGVIASIILILARLVQGLSVSCEFPTSILILGSVSNKYRGLVSSLSFASGVMGMLLATGLVSLLSWFLSTDDFESWGWRVPFILGFLLSFIGYHIRKKVKLPNQAVTTRNPITTCFTRSKSTLLLSMLMSGATSAGFFSLFTFVPAKLLNQNEHSVFFTSTILACTMILYICFLILSGFISDKVGRYKMMFIGCLTLGFCTIPSSLAITSNQGWMVAVGLFALSISLAITIAPKAALLTEIFPKESVTAGMYVGYNFGISFIGGMTPLFLAYLSKSGGSNTSLQVLYISIALILGLIALINIRKEKNGYI